MKDTAQQSPFHKQIGLWLVAIAVILTAAFLRGKVNVRAAESLITKHTYINDQKDIWQLKDTKAGQTYKLKIEVGSAYSNPQLKYEWYYIPESNYTAEQKLSCTTSEISVTKSKYREDSYRVEVTDTKGNRVIEIFSLQREDILQAKLYVNNEECHLQRHRRLQHVSAVYHGQIRAHQQQGAQQYAKRSYRRKRRS